MPILKAYSPLQLFIYLLLPTNTVVRPPNLLTQSAKKVCFTRIENRVPYRTSWHLPVTDRTNNEAAPAMNWYGF